MRLQLRSSLVKPAKKVIGKQRLTVLVNVSFPAPAFSKKGSLQASLFHCRTISFAAALRDRWRKRQRNID